MASVMPFDLIRAFYMSEFDKLALAFASGFNLMAAIAAFAPDFF
jgi:hypothetical protein